MHISHILPLQNVRFAKFEIHVVKRRLHVQSRLKRCIFFSFFGKRFEAICLVSLVRKLIRVPLPLLWFGTSITNIHNIFKSANYNLTQDKHQNYNLFRLHCIDWSLFKEILMRRDTVISPLQHLGFVINWKKCVLTPVQKKENRVFGPGNQLCHSRTFFKRNKNLKSNLLNNPQTSVLELTKLIGLLTSTIHVVLPAGLNCRFLQMQQILSLSEYLSYLFWF